MPEMLDKMRKIMQFFIETRDYKQITQSFKEYQFIAHIFSQMNLYISVLKSKEIEEIAKIYLFYFYSNFFYYF